MAEFDPIEEKAEGTNYDPIIPKIREWPIAKLYEDKSEFLDEVVQYTLDNITDKYVNAEGLEQDIAKAYYSELQRIKRQPWKVDKKDEGDFWNAIKREANKIESDDTDEEKEAAYLQISRTIIARYAEEIAGSFKPSSYHFAKRFLSFGFASLLNAFQARNIKAVFDHKIYIQDRIKLIGHIDHIRSLGKKGTIILLPTHFSNLDSIMIAWSIHAAGLPAFIYAAGLNLFNSRLVGYFMNRLGAYKLDRRKKNTFYLETLKSYSSLAIKRGVHSLFFPGGTRSRNGGLESNLKLGMLGTCFDAQRLRLEEAEKTGVEPKKIFVVPMVMSYHFVLEAKSLIRQYLKQSKAERYAFKKNDEYKSKKKVTSFIIQMLAKKSDIFLSYGKPMDLFGNDVDDDGVSLDPNGRPIDIKDYYVSDGEIKNDPQRDRVYTQNLGEVITERYLKENIVLTSHLMAFCTYQTLLKRHRVKDVFGLREQPKETLEILMEEMHNVVSTVVARLKQLEQEEALKLSNTIELEDIDTIIRDGIKNVGIFHNAKPLMITKEGNVRSEDLELLFYYNNRMNGYGLEREI